MKKIIRHLRNLNIKTDQINKIKKEDKILFILRTDLIGDHIVSRSFLRAIRESEKFKSYKIVFLGNIAYRDMSLDFDSKYVDEFIWLNRELYFENKLYRYLLKQKINTHNYAYALNYLTIRNMHSEEIIKDVKAKEKYGIQGRCVNITEEQREYYNTFYTQIFDCSDGYGDGGYDLAEILTGEKIERHPPSFELSEEKIKDEKYNFPHPFAILFPSASYKQKRLGFDKYLQFAKHLYEKHNIFSYISGSASDRKIFEEYDLNLPYIKDICGEYKLSELPYIFKNAKIILTNDTSGMYIGKCVNDNILVFSNVRIAPKECFKTLTNEQNEPVYLCYDCFYYIYPQKSVDAILNQESAEKEDVTINQNLSDISMSSAFYSIDYILNNAITETY